MKFNLLGKVASLMLGTAMLTCPSNLQAGWGILHGGGSSGFGSGGSSGGYAGSNGGGSSGYASSYSSYGGGSTGGSSGYSASYASSGGGSSGGGRGPGLLQRLSSRLHSHHSAKLARRASYGSSGYGSGGYGSSGYSTSYASSGGGSSGGYGSSYGYSGGSSGGASYNYGSVGYSSGVSYGSTGGSSGVNYGSSGYSSGYGSGGDVYYGASNVDVGAAAGSLVSNVESKTMDDAVYLTVAVPNGAKVYVNDNETSSTGVVRKFVSRGLQAGKQYRFQVRAEMADANGKLMTEEKTLAVSAGEEQQVQFAFAEQDNRVETAITLNLPEGAKVTLAGNTTKATGQSRTFRTSRLKSGEFWDDYNIEVEYEGEVKRQSIRLVGGDKLQLTFDFDSSASTLAAR